MYLTRLSLSFAALVLAAGCGSASRVQLESPAAPVMIAQPALYPETIEANPKSGKFLVSSVREGAVYEVGLDGTLRVLVQDDRLTSILGISIDSHSNRLLVTNSDLGAGVRSSSKGARKEAGVGIYDLTSGQALHYADLTPLLPGVDHLINGITVDADGNAYATDSFAPVIYKVDPSGVPSVFLQADEFKGQGINLNGIAYHPDGFLLVIKKSSGALYRVPLADPHQFSRVRIPLEFPGGDGLLLVGSASLVLIANQTPDAASNAAFSLRSGDGWASAKVVESRGLGSVYPTTCTALNGKLYVLSSHLNEWIGAQQGVRDELAGQGRRAEIQEIGVAAP
jgi:sugar lactone lactonase YvrE